MKKLLISTLMLYVWETHVFADSAILPMGKITLRATDDTQKPVSGVTAGLGWSKVVMLGTVPNIQPVGDQGKTDENGFYTSSGGAMPFVEYNLQKEGFYNSYGKYKFTEIKDNQSLPWNPTVDVALRPVVNPIAMYAKRYFEIVLPVSEVGYDLIKGDFVAPHGQGEVADCVLSATGMQEGEHGKVGKRIRIDGAITFLGDFNGIEPILSGDLTLESVFIWPRYAPRQGYEQKSYAYHYSSEVKAAHGKSRPVVNRIETRTPDVTHFFFRIRSEKNPDGSFKSALYGKMPAPESFALFTPRGSKDKKLKTTLFSFYVNPTRNDLNMEYNAKDNHTLSHPHEEISFMESQYWSIRKYPNGEWKVTQP